MDIGVTGLDAAATADLKRRIAQRLSTGTVPKRSSIHVFEVQQLEGMPILGGRGALDQVEILLGPPDQLARLIPHCPKLRWVQSTWAGVAPLITLPARNYTLTALKGVFGPAMSEYLFAWLLALERNIPSRLGSRSWNPLADGSLLGKRLGIMGTGSIGVEVARVAKAFQLHVVGFNSDGCQVDCFDACFGPDSIGTFAAGLDYVFSVLPQTPATDQLIDHRFLAELNPGAIVVNAGRGNVIVDDDLIAALDNGSIRAAVLDVFLEEPLPQSHPFWSHPNVHISSHSAAPTPDEAALTVFLDNLQRYCLGKPLRHVVDFHKGY